MVNITDNDNKTILNVSHLHKYFRNVNAVNDISFAIGQGDIFALLGPNGAGKTTILRMLLDIIKTDSGQIVWNLDGKNGSKPQSKHIGYLPEERGLYLDIPVLKSLIYLATIRGVDKTEAKKSAMVWLDKLGLANRAHDKLQVLSKGNQQKVQFIASILHKPTFAILDEPFSGLDPLNQEIFIGHIKEINEQGTTVLLSAHQMSLVEKVVNKIFFINNGEKIYYGSLSGIYNTLERNNIIDVHLDSPVGDDTFKNLKNLESFERMHEFRVNLTFGLETGLNMVLAELAQIKGICNITSHKPDLHDIFLQLVKTQKQ